MVCEAALPCVMFGAVGFRSLPFGIQRHHVMYFALFFSVAGLIFLIAGICATSTNNTTIMRTAWAVGSGKGDTPGRVFVGLVRVVYKANGDVNGIDISDVDCDELGDACDSCVDAVSSILPTAILGVITQLPQILTDLQRSTSRGDRNCQKVFGVVTGIFGCVTTIIALSEFGQSCWRIDADRFNMQPGPGFILTVLATLLKVVDVFCHLVLPMPPLSARGTEEEPKNAKDTLNADKV